MQEGTLFPFADLLETTCCRTRFPCRHYQGAKKPVKKALCSYLLTVLKAPAATRVYHVVTACAEENPPGAALQSFDNHLESARSRRTRCAFVFFRRGQRCPENETGTHLLAEGRPRGGRGEGSFRRPVRCGFTGCLSFPCPCVWRACWPGRRRWQPAARDLSCLRAWRHPCPPAHGAAVLP